MSQSYHRHPRRYININDSTRERLFNERESKEETLKTIPLSAELQSSTEEIPSEIVKPSEKV